jgi:hypothetical protein
MLLKEDRKEERRVHQTQDKPRVRKQVKVKTKSKIKRKEPKEEETSASKPLLQQPDQRPLQPVQQQPVERKASKWAITSLTAQKTLLQTSNRKV